MPYIKQENRHKLEYALSTLIKDLMSLEEKDLDGNLNYCISKLLLETFDIVKNPSYAKLNRLHGVLSCADKEIYRRITGPYEDKAIKKNGDIC